MQSRDVAELGIRAMDFPPGLSHDFQQHGIVRHENYIVISAGGLHYDLKLNVSNQWDISLGESLNPNIGITWAESQDTKKNEFAARLREQLKRPLKEIILWFDTHRDWYGHLMAAQVHDKFIKKSLNRDTQVWRVRVPSLRPGSALPRPTVQIYRQRWAARVQYNSYRNQPAILRSEALIFKLESEYRLSVFLSQLQRDAFIEALPESQDGHPPRLPRLPFGLHMTRVLRLIRTRYRHCRVGRATSLHTEGSLLNLIFNRNKLIKRPKEVIERLLEWRFIAEVAGGKIVPSQVGDILGRWHSRAIPASCIREWNSELLELKTDVRDERRTRESAIRCFLRDPKFTLMVSEDVDRAKRSLIRQLSSELVASEAFNPLPHRLPG